LIAVKKVNNIVIIVVSNYFSNQHHLLIINIKRMITKLRQSAYNVFKLAGVGLNEAVVYLLYYSCKKKLNYGVTN